MAQPRKWKRNEMIVACYRQGLSLREVAAELDIKRSTVHVILKRDAPELLRARRLRRKRTI